MNALIRTAVLIVTAGSLHAAEDNLLPLTGSVPSIEGKSIDPGQYAGKVVMVVNVASQCGFTKQYQQLQELYSTYEKRGFVILGFPCNQFGQQEPLSEPEILAFCQNKFSVTFPMFSKIDVNGENASPLYKALTSLEAPLEDRGPVRWNFEKFLLNREGQIIQRYRSKVAPDAAEVIAAIEDALGHDAASPSGGAEPGFVEMFNGKDLTGWNTTGNWVVEDNHTIALKPRAGERGWTRYKDYLTTDQQYGNVILDLEFKFNPQGNSGVFMRVGDLADHVSSGFEVQILDTHGKASVGEHDCGGVIRTAAPSKNMVKPAGEWNRYVITLMDTRLTVVLNGEQIIDLDLSTSNMKDRPAKGYISFQDEGKPIWYRNVRIKELD
ncbi:MAG: DUF1080 domain-containing protein [Verrucomicrobia bacterium]|nr:DUF1080 domain-containing protein [Verrucomicrobiota bacterium]